MPTAAQRIQDVFLAASEIADLAERDRLLHSAFADEPELRARVEALLRARGEWESALARYRAGRE